MSELNETRAWKNALNENWKESKSKDSLQRSEKLTFKIQKLAKIFLCMWTAEVPWNGKGLLYGIVNNKAFYPSLLLKLYASDNLGFHRIKVRNIVS